MKVTLRKINNTPLDFEVKSNEIIFKGYLQYHAGKLILLKAKLTGSTDVQCSQCGDEFQLPVDENIELFISDGIYEDDGSLEIDVVESLDSQADIDELLNSEVELIKSDYHSCKNCKEI